MTTIYEELINAASTVGFKGKAVGQSDNEHLAELTRCISKVSDEVWNGLSKQAGEWANQAAQAVNAMQPVQACPGYTSESPVSQQVPASTPVKKEEKKVTRTAPPPKVKRVRQTGVVDAIRKTFILHPDWTVKQAHDYLIANGFPDLSIDTIAVNAGDIRHVIILAREMGFWNDEKYKETAAQQEPASTSVPTGDSGENKTE